MHRGTIGYVRCSRKSAIWDSHFSNVDSPADRFVADMNQRGSPVSKTHDSTW